MTFDLWFGSVLPMHPVGVEHENLEGLKVVVVEPSECGQREPCNHFLRGRVMP